MKPVYIAVLLSLLPLAAGAQVVINQAALDQLAGIKPVAAMPVAAPVATRPRPRPHLVARVKPASPVVAAVAPAPAPTRAPTRAPTPAPTPAPAPVQPVVAKPVVAKLPPLGPVTIAFAPGGTDLPANAAAALQPVCARAGADGLVTIDAYAPADGSDISAPMRNSLTRAFAVRDALSACGIPAAHIIPKADGAVAGRGPDDAVVSLGVAGNTGTAK